MGISNVFALSAESAVIAWYVLVPISHGQGQFLVGQDFAQFFNLRQSFAPLMVFALLRMILFVYIRRTNKFVPATRCFVLVVMCLQLFLGVPSIFQPLVFLLDTSATPSIDDPAFLQQPFERLHQVLFSKSYVVTLFSISVVAWTYEIWYILRLNKSRGSLADDKLMSDVLAEELVAENPLLQHLGADAAENAIHISFPSRLLVQEQQDLVALALWRRKWNKLVGQFQLKKQRRSRSDATFEAIVRLYAHREGAVERLALAYDRNPLEVEFYLPQLCSFLLLGAFIQSPQLCILLLQKCNVSHVFAHRMRWYLHSYCLQNPVFAANEERTERVQMLIEEVEERGQEPTRMIEKPPPPPRAALKQQQSSSQQSVKYDEEAEALLHSSKREDQYCTFQDPVNSVDLERGTSASGTLLTLTSPPKVLPEDPFGRVTEFLTALARISSNLRSTPILSRNNMLRAWLDELQIQFLPSEILYFPVGNPYHRVKRLQIDECFTFSTRERVPFLLCAEVVDYSSPNEKIPERQPSLFHGRHLLSLFDKTTSTTTTTGTSDTMTLPPHPPQAPSEHQHQHQYPYPNVSMDRTAASPDVTKLGFWSENKPSSPKKRSLSQHFATSLTQPSEILTDILHSLANKAAKAAAMEESNGTPTNSSTAVVCSSPHGTTGSCSVENTGLSVVLDAPLQYRSSSEPLRVYSPTCSPLLSPGSPFSPPPLDRIDSTDRYLLTMSERESKYLMDDEDLIDQNVSSSSKEGILAAAAGAGAAGGALASLSTNTLEATAAPPPCVIFKERWKEKEARIRGTSLYGEIPGWRLVPVIVKANDDLRQEQLASQLIKQFSKVFVEAKLPPVMRPYDVIAISATSGLVEAVPDTISLDSLKKNDPEYTNLLQFFLRHFGDYHSCEFKQARTNFVNSMACYSIVCYLLQVKDRHNGNLLLDAEGHLIHIDFGFFLNNNPGNVHFEQAPFKLTEEFVQLMGGPRSSSFRKFRSLCVRAFLVARKYRHRFILLVEMMIHGNEHLPCFGGDPRGAVERLAARFQPEMDINECENFVHSLIDMSLDNWRTKWYDKYQRWFVGVF